MKGLFARERFLSNRLRDFLTVFALLFCLASGRLATELIADDLPPIAFTVRVFAGAPDPQTRTEPVERASQGDLMVWENGVERTLVSVATPLPFAPIDVSDPSVSWDGERIVFAGLTPDEHVWRIFEVHTDGSGLRQITRSDRDADLSRHGDAADFFARYDDVDPCYLPDGRICFVSTRYPQSAPGGRLRATNLHVVNADGSDVHRITTERFGADTPAVDPTTGEIVYSRWWITEHSTAPPPTRGTSAPYYGPAQVVLTPVSDSVLRGVTDRNFPGVNNWQLASIRPDGSGLRMYTGFRLNRQLTMAYRPSFLASGEVMSLFIRQSPFLGYSGDHGLRLSRAGNRVPAPLGGPQQFSGDGAFPDPFRLDNPRFETPALVYHSAEELPDGRLLVSASATDPRTNGATEYEIYVQDRTSGEHSVLFGASSRRELDAVPVVARPRPPILRDEAPRLAGDTVAQTRDEAIAANGSFTFKVANIFFNADVNVPVANAPPVGNDLVIEFYMKPQGSGIDETDAPILVGQQEIAEDGRIEMELPAGVPLFEVLRRTDGRIAQGRDGQIFHVGGANFGVAGSEAECVGCHAGHSQMEVPKDASWFNIAPSALVSASTTEDRLTSSGRRAPVLSPAALVDRRTDFITSEWASQLEDSAPWVRMRWRTPIRAREVVVRGIDPTLTFFAERNPLKIHGFRVETYLNDAPVQVVQVSETVDDASGTTVPLDESEEFNVLRISIDGANVEGNYEGEPRTALSEIEVLGQLVVDGIPHHAFKRGDADCDTRINVTDAIAILGGLYLGSGFCCRVAGDVDDNGMVNLADAVYVLVHQFLGGEPPAEPQDCGLRPAEELDCDEELCP